MYNDYSLCVVNKTQEQVEKNEDLNVQSFEHESLHLYRLFEHHVFPLLPGA